MRRVEEVQGFGATNGNAQPTIGSDADNHQSRYVEDRHSEAIHQMILMAEEYLGIGPTYTNNAGCGPQCRAAQQAINAIILFIGQ